MTYIGFNVSDEILEKLKIISFVSKKNRTKLIKEGLDYIIETHAKDFDTFKEYTKNVNKNKQ